MSESNGEANRCGSSCHLGLQSNYRIGLGWSTVKHPLEYVLLGDHRRRNVAEVLLEKWVYGSRLGRNLTISGGCSSKSADCWNGETPYAFERDTQEVSRHLFEIFLLITTAPASSTNVVLSHVYKGCQNACCPLSELPIFQYRTSDMASAGHCFSLLQLAAG
jgi:hypothetical protein